MFFAVWKHSPIKTTLLRELEEVCDVTYREFEDPDELRSDLHRFFSRVDKANHPITSPNGISAGDRGGSLPGTVRRKFAYSRSGRS
jgi:hypothetical protein